MALTTYDNFIQRVTDGYSRLQPIYGERAANTGATFGNLLGIQYVGDTQLMPSSLPTGVTSFIPTRASIASTQGTHSMLLAQMIDLGSLDLATPTFTDGNAMPTVTELGTSRGHPSPIIGVVETVLNATPGSITVTYKDQDNNTAEVSGAKSLSGSALPGSAGWVNLNSGDSGAIDITTATRTGGTTPTGVIRFYGLIPIMLVPANLTASSSKPVVEDLLCVAPNLVRIGISGKIGAFSIGNNVAKVTFGDLFLVGDS